MRVSLATRCLPAVVAFKNVHVLITSGSLSVATLIAKANMK